MSLLSADIESSLSAARVLESSTFNTTSPTWSPALAAGPFSVSCMMVGNMSPVASSVEYTGTRTQSIRMNAMIIASSTFVTGPASITRKRFQTGFALNLPGSFSASSSSPSNWQEPPNGSARRAYSVSPFLNLKTAGPKPIEKPSMRKPSSFPTVKWPSSWKNIRNVRTKRESRI